MKYQFGLNLKVLVSVIFLFSCTSDEIGNSKDVNPEAIIFDYEVWSEEGKEHVLRLTYNISYGWQKWNYTYIR